ncbi:MAG: hypothetical protein K6G60_03845 [Lachnospiraceae bacterium]|nr:hypothetical protein [Lachnospiraceae bacterium]
MKEYSQVITEKQDMTFLKWSHIRSSSGTAGTFLKTESVLGGVKKYYKLSNFDPVNGIVGHECVNELIVDRLLNILGVEHIHYELINALVEIEGKEYSTYICASEDFKKPGESKAALDDFYAVNAAKGEGRYDFCVRMGWQDYIDIMLAVDYLILNRDRHGANIEVLRDPRKKSLRIAPLFDHGVSLLFNCKNDDEARKFDVLEDRPCQNFLGSRSVFDNLSLIKNKRDVFKNELKREHKELLFKDLDTVISETFRDKIWEMIFKRYETYEDL